MASATSSRTAWRFARPDRTWCASTCCARRGGNSSGRRAALVAAAIRPRRADRISDDCAWLACTVAHYVAATGAAAAQDEPVGFLTGDPLAPDEHDRFFLPDAAPESCPLSEHCARALDHSLPVGSHPLPLMGTGHWNDGMNRIGEAGRGESVWLGF